MKKYILLSFVFAISCSSEKSISYQSFFEKVETNLTGNFKGTIAQNNINLVNNKQQYSLWLKTEADELITITIAVAQSDAEAAALLDNNQSKISATPETYTLFNGGFTWENGGSYNIMARDKNVYFKISSVNQATAQPMIDELVQLLERFDVNF